VIPERSTSGASSGIVRTAFVEPEGMKKFRMHYNRYIA
jgi:hypothetical protein